MQYFGPLVFVFVTLSIPNWRKMRNTFRKIKVFFCKEIIKKKNKSGLFFKTLKTKRKTLWQNARKRN